MFCKSEKIQLLRGCISADPVLAFANLRLSGAAFVSGGLEDVFVEGGEGEAE